MKIDWFYKNREERSKWLSLRFENEFRDSESVLDIGCYMADLKNFIPKDIKYTGIDIEGKPDLNINLDKTDRLPFDDSSFDTIVCADVLEHLENIHLIFDEICRISNKYIIITLPNTYADILRVIRKKKYTNDQEKMNQFGKYLKFYGLPFEKPDDRHRWFFSIDEAYDFLTYRSSKNGFVIKSFESEKKYIRCNFFKRAIKSLISAYNKNLAEANIIVLLSKK